MKDQGKPFEIIFVSSDRTDDSFNEYLKDMPWLAVPFGHPTMKTTLTSHFGVQGEPSQFVMCIPCHRNLSQSEHRKTILYLMVLHPTFPSWTVQDIHVCSWVGNQDN